ncbi:MAG: hypothetical protein ACOYEW_11505 [Anaerolineae bacterium]|jgi:hypothetical protein
MKIVGFEQGKVTVQLDAGECQAVAQALRLLSEQPSRVGRPTPRPLADAFSVCARIAAAQSRQALVIPFPRPPLTFARQTRSIVLVD